ncbi:hypothetical protein RFI_10724 [Reticulomyxa filosa]|uniref:Uncharacterized protein n=1 Tax=Reticulomyxa filosa TaxID=46433 RepID=X6NKJ1_RETFI|nr:hypothetical protein RFI_10724 [Reticulomyxa filosa]|eukprot:ETO26413.1 hypothetical protein RFI_10724 [Reticulomyxa filosa]
MADFFQTTALELSNDDINCAIVQDKIDNSFDKFEEAYQDGASKASSKLRSFNLFSDAEGLQAPSNNFYRLNNSLDLFLTKESINPEIIDKQWKNSLREICDPIHHPTSPPRHKLPKTSRLGSQSKIFFVLLFEIKKQQHYSNGMIASQRLHDNAYERERKLRLKQEQARREQEQKHQTMQQIHRRIQTKFKSMHESIRAHSVSSVFDKLYRQHEVQQNKLARLRQKQESSYDNQSHLTKIHKKKKRSPILFSNKSNHKLPTVEVRLQQWDQQKQIKLQHAREKHLQESCTFQPQTNRSTSNNDKNWSVSSHSALIFNCLRLLYLHKVTKNKLKDINDIFHSCNSKFLILKTTWCQCFEHFNTSTSNYMFCQTVRITKIQKNVYIFQISSNFSKRKIRTNKIKYKTKREYALEQTIHNMAISTIHSLNKDNTYLFKRFDDPFLDNSVLIISSLVVLLVYIIQIVQIFT